MRQEIEAALAHGKPLFTVPVEGARMPGATELPPAFAALASANAIALSDAHFGADLAKLVNAMRVALRRWSGVSKRSREGVGAPEVMVLVEKAWPHGSSVTALTLRACGRVQHVRPRIVPAGAFHA